MSEKKRKSPERTLLTRSEKNIKLICHAQESLSQGFLSQVKVGEIGTRLRAAVSTTSLATVPSPGHLSKDNVWKAQGIRDHRTDLCMRVLSAKVF